MVKELIRLAGLSKFYTGSQSVVVGLNSLDIRFSRGEFVAITGESGSGKSTLSHVLGGILPYESGEMFFGGNPTSHYDSADWERYRLENISFISQNYGILPGATVQENVVSALLLTGMDKQEANDATESLLRQVELWDLRSRRAAKLSSGQKQRLSIARALAKPAPVLIADEPTGNLDPENSAKVIRLLSQAAKERLVILVTHEFSEAADCATRHVVLQDGKIVMDASLRPANEPEPMADRKCGGKPVGAYVGRLQQRSRPVWSCFMAVFFALTAFAIFAFLGTFIVNLDDSSTRVYDNSVFRNGDPQRIVVTTLDGSPMTREDHDALVNADYVERLETYGYVTDVQYGYRENVDYELVAYETGGSGEETQVHVYARVYNGAPYVQTIPILPEGAEFLTAGQEPENLYEVVAFGDESLLGQQFTVYIANRDYWPEDQSLPLEVTVVGVTDCGSGLYFHTDLGRLCMQVAKTATDGYAFLPMEDLSDDMFRGHMDLVGSMASAYNRLRDDMAATKTLITGVSLYDREFDNINYQQDGDSNVSESVTLTIAHTDLGFYYLYNISSEETLFCNSMSWISYGTDIFSPTAFGVQLYPVGDTVPAEDGSLTSGQYVIWNPSYQLALSSRVVQNPSAIGISYEAVPVIMEDGVLSGYTEEEIWDIELILDEIVSISHNNTPLTFAGVFGDTSGGFSRFWIAQKARTVTGIHELDQRRMVEVSFARFDELTWNGGCEQVSLTITDFGYTQRVLDQIQNMGYAALSPYQLGSLAQDPELAQEREQTLLVCLLALAAVIVLQLILLRAMFTAQMESYRLLSNIGLSAKMAKRSVLWQILSFAAAGQALSIAALAVCWYRGVERIRHIIHYLPIHYMLLLVAVHLVVSVMAALWVMAALRKQVYALTGRQSDLPMDEEEKGAVS